MEENITYIKLRERPELKQTAADWFHNKWGVPTKAYLDCMDAYLSKSIVLYIIYRAKRSKNQTKPLLLFNTLYRTSVHLPNLIHVAPELVNHIVGVQQLRLFAKAQNPTEELVADFHLCGDTEVSVIHSGILNILCAEAVNNCIQERMRDVLLNVTPFMFTSSSFVNPCFLFCQLSQR